MFHYAWLLLSIVVVAWELPEDSQFPLIASDLPGAAKFASLWATKDPERVKNSKIFLGTNGIEHPRHNKLQVTVITNYL